VRDWHRAFWRRNIGVDVVAPWADLTPYEVVVVPTLFLTDDSTAARITSAAENGATVVVTFMSGIVDETNRIPRGGYPGAFADLMGVRVEEIYPLQRDQSFMLDNGGSGTDWTEDVTLLDAHRVASYAKGPHAGRLAVTRRSPPSGGRAFYVSCLLDEASLDALSRTVLPDHRDPSWPEGLEVLTRESREARFVSTSTMLTSRPRWRRPAPSCSTARRRPDHLRSPRERSASS
jgi:beta-galactosidase